MTKVVYNACYGGFSLSREAVLRARELSGNPSWGGPCIKGDKNADGTLVERDYGFCHGTSRTDPTLVLVVEEMGKKASGPFADLQISNVLKGTQYRIDEYDGFESVMTIDDYDWNIA